MIATTHKKEKLKLLQDADLAVLDTGKLSDAIPKASKALELVGPKTLPNTLRCVQKGGIVCDTGILGGIGVSNGFDPIKGIPNGVYLTGFYSNEPDQAAIQEIFDFLDTHRIHPCIGKIYSFSEIREVCMAMEQGKVNGKIVVTVSERKGEETWMQRRA